MTKRILKDIETIRKNEDFEMKLKSAFEIECVIKGPKDTIYENGKWRVSILFTNHYPFKSPSVGFLDKIYHPNIDLNSGSICLNVLNDSWSPIYTGLHILETFIPQLLTYPNPLDPLNEEASRYYLQNRTKFNEQVNKYLRIS